LTNKKNELKTPLKLAYQSINHQFNQYLISTWPNALIAKSSSQARPFSHFKIPINQLILTE
jgi:hypothetical protein